MNLSRWLRMAHYRTLRIGYPCRRYWGWHFLLALSPALSDKLPLCRYRSIRPCMLSILAAVADLLLSKTIGVEAGSFLCIAFEFSLDSCYLGHNLAQDTLEATLSRSVVTSLDYSSLSAATSHIELILELALDCLSAPILCAFLGCSWRE